jgi:hypothetical protein
MNTNTPVLVIGFNRPDLLLQVLNDKNLSTRRVYISIDGPRNSAEARSVHRCIELASRFMERHPDTLIRTSQVNLGCKLGVSSAIDWVFNQENAVIILEDDVVPNDFFYVFMDEMLKAHEENHDIWQISGHCALPVDLESTRIYLSQFPQIWGWATWKSRWEKYDRNLENWTGTSLFDSAPYLLVNRSAKLNKYWTERLNECKSGFDTWDYQWVYSMWANAAWAISPGQSLCANQGFDERATHTKSSDHKQRDRLVSTTAHVDLTLDLEIDTQLDEVISYISYGIKITKENIYYKLVQKAIPKERLRSILIFRNPIMLAKKFFWATWNFSQILRVMNFLGIWKFLVRIKKLLIKPRH